MISDLIATILWGVLVGFAIALLLWSCSAAW